MISGAPELTVVDSVSVWRLTYVHPDPPLVRFSSMHTFAIVDVRRGAYLALEVSRFPRRRLFSRTRRPDLILPMCHAGDVWQPLRVTEGGRSSQPPAGDWREGPGPPPVRALWMVHLHDPARSPLTVVIDDGPLDLIHGPPGGRERWQVSGRAVPGGVEVDFDFDFEYPGYRAALKKIIFGAGRAYALLRRMDPNPPLRFTLTPATEEDLAVFRLPPSAPPDEHWHPKASDLEWYQSVQLPRDWTEARREFARLQAHDGWRSLSQ